MLSKRQGELLKLIVENYIKTAKPVSSKALCKKLKCSSATVRNEMVVLEQFNLIEKTHISSGRIPSDLGYRYYVDNIMVPKELTGEDMIKLRQIFSNNALVLSDAITKSMEIVSELTNYTAVVLGKSSDDNKMKKTLGETGGLGTVATRADIIEKLFHSFLLENRGNEILLTSKGKQLLELVPEDLKKPELTASWEMELAKIAKGAHKEQVFIKDIESYTKELIQDIKTSDGTFRHDNLTNTKCPHCGKRMLSVKGKNSRMLVCQDRECGYRETIARTSNARCPNCHKRMELIKKGDSETFVCSCGYKEKLEAFKNRRAKEGAGVSKRDVQKYLKKQQQQNDEPVNNAFAQALAGLKLDK